MTLVEPFAPTSTSPAPGTSTGDKWGDFLRVVLNGTRDIFRTPDFNGNAGYAGTNVTMPTVTPAAAGGGLIGLLVIAAIVVVVMKA